MRLCGKLMDIWLTPSGVVASQIIVSQQISCISLAVGAGHKVRSQDELDSSQGPSWCLEASPMQKKRTI